MREGSLRGKNEKDEICIFSLKVLYYSLNSWPCVLYFGSKQFNDYSYLKSLVIANLKILKQQPRSSLVVKTSRIYGNKYHTQGKLNKDN